MVVVEMEYEGELHCRAVHEPSGAALATDAPADNQGRGQAFSPTDLVGTALGTCILTTMAIKARSLGFELSGATARVEKTMASAPVRRIERLAVSIHVPQALSEKQREQLERAAHGCPVHACLHPEVQAPIAFTWG